jgi:N-acyl-D-amino-acid deacylase
MPSGAALNRRQFIALSSLTAAALCVGSIGARAAQSVGPSAGTGDSNPRTAAYDEMMAAFMAKYRPPGAALAVTKDGRLVYARGFGYADTQRKDVVQPSSLFRIASLTKPFTATAVMQLMQQSKLKLDDKVFSILKLQPFLARGARVDQRIYGITVQQCLQHTGGWDRDKGFDPMSADAAQQIARALGVGLPINPEQIIRYTMGTPLQTDPGTTYAYSNFGYCVLGRVIQAMSGGSYDDYVTRRVLAPVGITGMRLGKNLLKDRAPGEVRYYDSGGRTGPAISGPDIGHQVPLPYGVECIETMDANGGWIASPVMLVRFLDAFNDIKNSTLLNEASITAMLARPPGAPGLDNGKPAAAYYGCGWMVRPIGGRQTRYTKWHFGLLSGSSTLMVARDDGLNWAVLFNSDADKDGNEFSGSIDALMHQTADAIRQWPDGDLYSKFKL